MHNAPAYTPDRLKECVTSNIGLFIEHFENNMLKKLKKKGE
jgi:hypothetical protein